MEWVKVAVKACYRNVLSSLEYDNRREIITLTSDNRHIPDKTSDFSMHYMKWIYPRRLRNQMI